MMTKWNWLCYGLGGTLTMLTLAGCEATQGQKIERRIQQEFAFFETLPEDTQERLKNGQLQVGDPMMAAWIVHGMPTRTYEHITESSTNEVWSYCTVDAMPVDQFQAVHYPVLDRRGRTVWETDYHLQRSYLYDRNEYLRLELRENTVRSIDIIKIKK